MKLNNYTDVIIAGGGPVGMLLGIFLLQMGISCRIIERRMEPYPHSRSIGIHPPSLHLLEEAGVVEPVLEQGVQIDEGLAYLDGELAGSVNFKACPPPYPFIVSLPQNRSEQILEQRLNQLDPGALLRGWEVSDVNKVGQEAEIIIENTNSKIGSDSQTIRGKIVAGCDGKNSDIRNWAGIPFQRTRYPDTYVMGDFADNTRWGPKAAVILHLEGLIESFPLSGNKRRWVAKTGKRLKSPTPENITNVIRGRFGSAPDPSTCTMASGFGVEKALAQTMVSGNMLLAGDAAHLVSPIGGQGMNLGWLDAWDAAEAIRRKLRDNDHVSWAAYNQKRRREAKICIRRAELNMSLGRKRSRIGHQLRALLAKAILRDPLRSVMARRFAMYDRNAWLI